MSYKPGGETSKFGNQYEADVLMYYLSKLFVEENYSSISLESYDSNLEQGTDIILEKKDNSTICIQVKSRNGNKNRWSISDLIKSNIIKNACHHINEGRSFLLVSPIFFPLLEDILNRAHSFNDYVEFEENCINKNDYNEILKLNKEINQNLNIESCDLLKFYKNFRIKCLSDDREYFIQSFANNTKISNCEQAYDELQNFPIKTYNLGKKYTKEDIYNILTDKGYSIFTYDKKIDGVKLIDNRRSFVDTLKHNLINKQLYVRDETKQVINILNRSKIAILYGRAGCGKSGIIYQLCQYFEEKNIQYLPLDLYVNIPNRSTEMFGKELGFRTSPVQVLASAANGEPCYLLLDQVDAINWDKLHMGEAYDVCRKLVSECNMYENIKIIFACREIDARKILKFIDNSEVKFEKCSVDLSKLNEEKICEILGDNEYRKVPKKVKPMLTNINNLKLYLEIIKSGQNFYINSVNELYQKYINNIKIELRNLGHEEEKINTFFIELVKLMEKSEYQRAYIDSLKSIFSDKLIEDVIRTGIIFKTNEEYVKFYHQSIYDYKISENIISKILSNKYNDVESIFIEYNDEIIEKYNIVKQVFEIMQGDDCFIDILEQIIFSKNISNVIKELAIEFLAIIKTESKHLSQIFLRIIKDEKTCKYTRYLVYRNEIFNRIFIRQKQFELLMESQDRTDIDFVINIILQIKNTNDCVNFLKNFICYNKKINNEYALSRIIDFIEDDCVEDKIFDIKLEMLKFTNYKGYLYVDFNKLILIDKNRVKKYINYFLTLNNNVSHNIAFAVIDEQCKDCILSIEWENPKQIIDDIGQYFYKNYNKYIVEKMGVYSINNEIETILKLTISSAVKCLSNSDIINLISRKEYDIRNISLENILYFDNARGVKILELIINSDYLDNIEFHTNRKSMNLFKQIISKFSDKLSDYYYNLLVEKIICYKSKDIKWLYNYRRQQKKQGNYYPFFEEEQKILLSILSSNRLDEKTQNYLKYLNRKFPNLLLYSINEDVGDVETGGVVSVISNKWTKFSSKTWLQIITNNKTGKCSKISNKRDKNGNFIEADLSAFENTVSHASSIKQITFINLALKHNNIRKEFIQAIARGICIDDSYAINRSKDYNCDLQIATYDMKLEFFKKYYMNNDMGFLKSFLLFIEEINVDLDDWIIDKLVEISLNSDVYEKNLMNVCPAEWDRTTLDNLTLHDFLTENINRVQTIAINILAKHLYDNVNYIDMSIIKSIINKCIASKHPAMYVSAINLLCPIYYKEIDYTIATFNELLTLDNKLIVYERSLQLVIRSLKEFEKTYQNIYTQIIDKQLKEKTQTVETVTNLYCYKGVFSSLVNKLIYKYQNDIVHTCLLVLKENPTVEVKERTRELLVSIPVDDEIPKSTYGFNDVKSIKEGIDYINKVFESENIKKIQVLTSEIIYYLEKEESIYEFSKIIFIMIEKLNDDCDGYILDDLIRLLVKLYNESKINYDEKTQQKCNRLINDIYGKYNLNSDLVNID